MPILSWLLRRCPARFRQVGSLDSALQTPQHPHPLRSGQMGQLGKTTAAGS